MTEEQYKKCIEIGYSFKSECRYFPFLNKDDFIKITISLAKVFNKDITEEEAKEIFDNIWEYKCCSSNPLNVYYYTFWGIADYFDNGTTDGMIPNYRRNKAFKENNNK